MNERRPIPFRVRMKDGSVARVMARRYTISWFGINFYEANGNLLHYFRRKAVDVVINERAQISNGK